MRGEINGKPIKLEAVSGKIKSNHTHKGNFKSPAQNHYIAENGRLFDSEQKMIEYLRQFFQNKPNATGVIEITTQFPVCIGCHSVIDQFLRDFPNIKIIIIGILPY